MKKLILATAALLGLASCTKGDIYPGSGSPDGDMTIRFTLALPGSGEVVYPPHTRALQDEPEYSIKNLSLYEFAVNDGAATFKEKHAIDVTTDLTATSAGEYSFSMTIPAEYYNQTRKFVFVANDAAQSDPAAGTPYADFCNTLASTALTTGQDASLLALADNGIAMSGLGKVNGAEDFVLTSSFSCTVELTRVVARVDVINNTPNLLVTKIAMKNAAAQACLMPQSTQVAPGAPDYIADLAFNANATLGTTYEAQNNNDLGIQKAFYMYERENAEGNTTTIEIEYTINGKTEGKVSVPFRKTATDDQSWVNIQRNHLYKVVLGNGEPIVTDKVEVQLIDEEWNVVELPSEVDCEQDKMNAALKVNRFTPFNAKSVDLGSKTVNSFYDKLAVSLADCPTDSYFTYTALKDAGLTAADAVLTDAQGNKYRLPTEGELNLLLPMWTEPSERDDLGNRHWGVYHPWWNDNTSTNDPDNADKDSYVLSDKAGTDGWVETIYLKNGTDGFPDKTTNTGETDGEYVISGQSWLKRGTTTESDIAYPAVPGTNKYNIAPVYGLRFQGTSQYAAYRWESCRIASDPLERYFSVKIKALKKDDAATSIDNVAQESFWAEDYIEFQFPASGWYAPSVTPNIETDNISHRGVYGCCWSSSRWDESTGARYLGFFYLNDAGVSHDAVGRSFPLRFVRVEE